LVVVKSRLHAGGAHRDRARGVGVTTPLSHSDRQRVRPTRTVR